MHLRRHRRAGIALALALAFTIASVAIPWDGLPSNAAWAGSLDEVDHERARRAVEAKQILPLTDILRAAQTTPPHQLLEAELEVDDGVWIYELKFLTSDGRVLKQYYNASTGALLRSRVRERRHGR